MIKAGMRKGDLLIALSIIFFAVLIFVGFSAAARTPAAQAVIYVDGEVYERIPLDTEKEIVLSLDYTNTITVKDGAAAVSHSDCPDQVCVRSGSLDAVGEVAVCLPNRVIVKIEGKTTGEEVDLIAGAP